MRNKINQNSIYNYLLLLFLFLILSSCAHKESIELCLSGTKYGFLGGLWHGIIAPFDFIAMFFRNDVTVYAQNNNGTWYAFGFILGSGGWGFLGGRGIFGNKRKK